MSYAEIGDNAISEGTVVTEPSNDAQAQDQSKSQEPQQQQQQQQSSYHQYQQYQQPEPYEETPRPTEYKYQMSSGDKMTNNYYELGFITKILGIVAFAFLCIGLLIWYSGLAALSYKASWLEILGSVLPMCLSIFVLLDKVPHGYNAILLTLMFSICTATFSFFTMIDFAKTDDITPAHRAVAAGSFFAFLGHALMVASCIFSFFGK